MSSAIPAIASTALAFVGGYIVAKTMGSQQESSKNKQDSNAKQTSSSKKEKEQEQSTSKKEEVEVETKFSDSGEYKMVLVVRQDLKMGKGKMCAQCSHATLGAYHRAKKRTPDLLRAWETIGQAKVVVKVDTEQQLLEVEEKAKKAGLVTYVVVDAGRTQIEAGSKTVLAIGPAPVGEIDKVTGQLKLL